MKVAVNLNMKRSLVHSIIQWHLLPLSSLVAIYSQITYSLNPIQNSPNCRAENFDFWDLEADLFKNQHRSAFSHFKNCNLIINLFGYEQKKNQKFHWKKSCFRNIFHQYFKMFFKCLNHLLHLINYWLFLRIGYLFLNFLQFVCHFINFLRKQKLSFFHFLMLKLIVLR